MNNWKLTPEQIKIKDNINRQGYMMPEHSCICGSEHFFSLANRDRYGIYYPVKICKRCGLIQTNPRMSEGFYKDFYKNYYEDLYGKITPENQKERGEIALNFLQLNGCKTILDVGCGAGGVGKVFKEYGHRVFLFDLPHTIFDLAGMCYDVIIYSHVFEHILDLNSELQQVRKLLSDDGIVYISTPGIRYLWRSYDMNLLNLLQNAHLYYFSLQTLSNVMSLNRFELIKGTEGIHATFKKSNIKYWKSDYNVKRYLWRMSYFRKLPRFIKVIIKKILGKFK